MKYEVIRTDTADAGIRKIILYVAQNFGSAVALEKLDEIEECILGLGEDPYIGKLCQDILFLRDRDTRFLFQKKICFFIKLIFIMRGRRG